MRPRAMPADKLGVIDGGRKESEPTGRRRIKVRRWHDIQPVLSGRYLVKGAVPATGLSAVFGHSTSGKTFLVVDLSMHVALGWDWFGRRTVRAGVAYVAAEGGLNIANRIEAFRRHHRIAEDEDVPFVLIPETVDLFDKDKAALLETIAEEAKALSVPLGLVVIDTVSKTLGAGKENTDDLAGYIANCERMAAALNCHVLLVHHRPKDSENRSLRGHSSFGAGVEAVLIVEADGNKRSAECLKMKDGVDGWQIGFELKSIDLGQDDDGDDVTSCVVVPKDGPARNREAVKLIPRQLNAMRALRDRIAPPGSVGDRTMYERSVPLADLKSIWVNAGVIDAEGRRGDLGDLRNALMRHGLIRVDGGQVTVTDRGWDAVR